MNAMAITALIYIMKKLKDSSIAKVNKRNNLLNQEVLLLVISILPIHQQTQTKL